MRAGLIAAVAHRLVIVQRRIFCVFTLAFYENLRQLTAIISNNSRLARWIIRYESFCT